jgi:polyhydroxybutyrate depolymerase
MNRRTLILAAAMTLVATPPILAIGEAAHFVKGNASTSAIISSGVRREYIVHVPAHYDGRTPLPLVISMHAAAMWPAAQERTTGWDAVADEKGFFVAYPAGADGRGPRTWSVDGSPALMRDVHFIADMIDTIASEYAIDTRRIYADGLSNGGGMAFVLSCTMHDRIAAVGLVASAQTLRFSWCPDTRPVPVIAFHGTADPVTPYRGGATWISAQPFPDITAWITIWSRRNRCNARPLERMIAQDVMRATYTGCAADVAFYSVVGGGHAWPGGQHLPEWFVGRTTDSINASRELWNFYSAHSLPR